MKKHFYNLFPSFLIMNSSLFILIFLLHLSSLSTAIVCIPTERDTLLKFKHSLTDPSHRLSSWNASSNSNCCLWHGVVCSNVTAHVLQLHLNTSIPNIYDYLFGGYYLDEEAYDRTVFGGEINPCLVDLKYLNYLDLSGNYFGSPLIPSFLGRMRSLTHLNLSYAGFMGNIPSQIGNLSNLLQLDLGRNYDLFAENLDWLSSLSKLQYLDLSGNELLGGGMPIPTFIGTMTSLSHLDLSDTGFMGDIPSQIGNLSNLVYLDLINAANGTIPSQIGNLFNLVYLHFQSDDLFPENFHWLSNLSKLEYLEVVGADLSKSIDWLHTLQALPSLKHLDLPYCTLPDHYNEPSLLNFSSLLTLDISSVFVYPVISSVPKWIFGLTKLISLRLSGYEIQGPIPDDIQNLTLLQNLDLSYNSFSSSIPDWLYSLHHLKFLDLRGNKLRGNISDSLGNLPSLIGLYLSDNQLEGTIPTSLGSQLSGNLTNQFGKLSSLKNLDLSKNQFGGNPFESLRSLSSLSYLHIDDNNFQGVVKEDDLANLTSLKEFHASGNNFTLKVGPNWLPTFQLIYLGMSSWQLGPNFPSWIRSQNGLEYLEMSNTGISDSIPTWFWEAFSQASHLNLSHNHIHGELVTTLKHPISVTTVDLSTNNLCGKLPYLSNDVYWLDISDNSLSESMGEFFCKQQGKPMQLEFLNLASNNLSGEIPDCWMIWPFLVDVNLQSNHFVGNLPPSMGSLAELQFLRIRNNSFSGIFPTIFKKTNKLISLDLGENNFSGAIPTWIGERLLSIKVLRLRSNRFLGHIPNKICNMSLLQILDLAQNNLSGNIPTCFNHLNAMTLMQKSAHPLIYCDAVNYTSIYSPPCIVSVLLWLKGRGDEYKNILGLVTSIDLSNNKLVGEIPREITDLNGLTFLNLSQNQLKGHIPQSIGNMGWLLSIDFSRNQLSGEIPPTISNLNFLSMLDLSYNHLKGKIPTGPQLQTFEAFNFIGNNLCGPPLPINCSSDGKIDSYDHNGNGSGRHGVNWFFVSMTFGFVVGFWIVIAPLFIWRSWRYAYFRFLDHVWFKLQSLF